MLIRKVRRRLAGVAIRILQRGRAIWYCALSTNVACGRPRLLQPLQLAGVGTIRFDADVSIGIFSAPGFLNTYAYIEARNTSAQVRIGSRTSINNGFRCIAEHTSISIGQDCLIGANVEILDSDFHGLGIDERALSKHEWAAPVVVEDKVFIGSNVRILKGVRVGEGAVIGNSALVISDIPPMVVAAGVPARVIRSIVQ